MKIRVGIIDQNSLVLYVGCWARRGTIIQRHSNHLMPLTQFLRVLALTSSVPRLMVRDKRSVVDSVCFSLSYNSLTDVCILCFIAQGTDCKSPP